MSCRNVKAIMIGCSLLHLLQSFQICSNDDAARMAEKESAPCLRGVIVYGNGRSIDWDHAHKSRAGSMYSYAVIYRLRSTDLEASGCYFLVATSGKSR